MSLIRNSFVLVGALPLVLGAGVWFSSPGHSTPAPPHARAAVARVEPQQGVAGASPVIVSATFVIGTGGMVMDEAVIVLTTFIHHMVIGSDSASVSPQPQLLTC